MLIHLCEICIIVHELFWIKLKLDQVIMNTCGDVGVWVGQS